LPEEHSNKNRRQIRI